jgi:hypothetical protein
VGNNPLPGNINNAGKMVNGGDFARPKKGIAEYYKKQGF